MSIDREQVYSKSDLAARPDSAAAWGVTAATFVSTFVVFGVHYSFGAFFGSMAEEFGSDRSTTSLFFALTTFLYFILGAYAGHFADTRGPRRVLVVGAVFMTGGLLALSYINSIELGYLTYGIGVGVGVACGYVPMVATVGGWFERHRTTALGLAVAGIGVGTLVVVPAAEWSIADRGWRETYRIMAAASAVLLLLAAIGARRPPIGARGEDEPPVLRRMRQANSSFWVLYAAAFFVTIALFTAFVYLGDYVATRSIDGSGGTLIALIGISSVLGRLGLGALAARTSAIRLYQGSFVVLGGSFTIWLVAGASYWMLVLFTIVLGVAYGGFIALSPAVTAELFGVQGLGATLGALYTSAGFGGLIGPPLVGWIIDRSGYTAGITVAFVAGLIGAACLFLPPVERHSQRSTG